MHFNSRSYGKSHASAERVSYLQDGATHIYRPGRSGCLRRTDVTELPQTAECLYQACWEISPSPAVR